MHCEYIALPLKAQPLPSAGVHVYLPVAVGEINSKHERSSFGNVLDHAQRFKLELWAEQVRVDMPQVINQPQLANAFGHNPQRVDHKRRLCTSPHSPSSQQLCYCPCHKSSMLISPRVVVKQGSQSRIASIKPDERNAHQNPRQHQAVGADSTPVRRMAAQVARRGSGRRRYTGEVLVRVTPFPLIKQVLQCVLITCVLHALSSAGPHQGRRAKFSPGQLARMWPSTPHA